MDTLILGLGNPLRGDDGIGPRVIQELLRRGLPAGVLAVDGGAGGLDLLRWLEGHRQVVVVDAADMKREPGQFVRFTPREARLVGTGDRPSLHNAGLGEVLTLAAALGRTLPEIVVYGVQPVEMDWRDGLSPAVESIIPALVDALLNEIKGGTYAQDPGD